MPSDTIADILGTRAFTEEDWRKLLDKRFNLIKPHLKNMSLSTLRDVECLRHEVIREHPIRLLFGEQEPEVECEGDIDIHLHTQGIYGFTRHDVKDLVVHVWGLTKEGQWILANVYFMNAWINGSTYEIARRISIRESTPKTIAHIARISARTIWQEMADEVFSWSGRRDWLAEQARTVASEIEAENTIIEALLLSR